MLAAIAHATGCTIGIAGERLETVSLAGLPEHFFTTDMSATHIRYGDLDQGCYHRDELLPPL